VQKLAVSLSTIHRPPGVSKLRNPYTDRYEFGIGDYVSDAIPQAKIQTDRPSGGVPANG